MSKWIRFFNTIGTKDVKIVGGKNASLGEMTRTLKKKGINVPPGFATTADLFWEFLSYNNINQKIQDTLSDWEKGRASLSSTGLKIRRLIVKGEFSPTLKKNILDAYHKLGSPAVAVRSSATAEDLPTASFAGQMESFVYIKGDTSLLETCKKCLASLFTDRAMSYRKEQGFDQLKIALSIGVQQMVRSDTGASGVMFTLDTETGFPDVVLINAIWGLGELIVKGEVDPDEYLVFKPLLGKKSIVPILEKTTGNKLKKLSADGKRVRCSQKEASDQVLSEKEIVLLARWAKIIEDHYGMPMDIEWAKDGVTGQTYIVQARPETVQSGKSKNMTIKTYSIKKKGKVLLTGNSVGRSIATGKVIKLKSAQQVGKFKEGCILVTEITDPDWVPIMKKASGIITDHGGRTSHAAIVSRELGLPAIVGTEKGTKTLKDGQEITLSSVEGDIGFVYDGIADFSKEEVNVETLANTKVQLMVNIADPATALMWWRLPAKGIGLARMEFIIMNLIQVHPMALVHWDTLKDKKAKNTIAKLTKGYKDKKQYFVDKLASGIAKIAASQWPHPVIVRLSDFKSNEYAQLIGGKEFEPNEENPMIGWRGASRYYHPEYKKGFALECRAIKKARESIGLKNIIIMIPFCRTLEEADQVLKVLTENGLKKGSDGLQVYVMCEIPSNVILAEDFAKRFDGFSIGSNDLTQLILGVDRDSSRVAPIFNERNKAVMDMLQEVIKKAKKHHCKIGICGQAPSDYPEFAGFLVKAGIDSISVTPDSFITVYKNSLEAEKKK